MNATQLLAGPITYRVDRKVDRVAAAWGDCLLVPRSWTTFRTPDGAEIRVETPALMMALAMSGVQLHRGMTLAEIAWACVAGVRAAGGPAAVEQASDRTLQMTRQHLAKGTDVRRDPEYKRLWGSYRHYSLCFSLVHCGLLKGDVPGGVDIPLDVEQGEVA